MLSKSRLISFSATANSQKARDFYEKALGLAFVSEDQFALVLEAKGTTLRIQKVGKVNPHPYTMLGWSVKNIEKEARELSARGVKFSRYEGMNQDELGIWHAPRGAKVAWFSDPDGNILSLTEYKK
ncbi:MAG: VOC family protein [Bacteroidota bacterium]